MSEEFENENLETENFESSEEDNEGLQKSISMGLKPHPITREMGLTLNIGNEQTWMSIGDAKRLVGDIEITITTAISLGTVMNMLSKMPEPSNKDLFVPKR